MKNSFFFFALFEKKITTIYIVHIHSNDLPKYMSIGTYVTMPTYFLTILFHYVLFFWFEIHFSVGFYLIFLFFFWSNVGGIGGAKSPDKNAFSLNKPVPGALYWKKATFFIFIWFYFYLTRWRLLRFRKEKKSASLASRRH